MEPVCKHDLEVSTNEAGVRLDQFLVGKLPQFTRSRLQGLIQDQHVTVNNAVTKPGAKVRAGDRIVVVEPPPAPTATKAEAIALDVLYEDDDLIVINKPPGMVVHPAAGNWEGTVVNALLHHCTNLSGVGGEKRPGIVHRLDKDTSGCLVAAKNDPAHQELARQFASREVTKIYLALASGKFRAKSGVIEAAIGRHPIHRKKMTVIERGRPSKTSWRVIREIGEGTLVECTLHTGRTHQIRVHLKHIGHPLLGDEVYGKQGKYPRQMLHAWKLGFTHPRSGKRVDVTAPVPPDFPPVDG